MDPRTIALQFQVSQRVLEKNLEDVDDAAARTRSSSGANCISWILGHMADARTGATRLLGGEPIEDAGELERYANVPAGEFDATSAHTLDELRDILVRTQGQLVAALESVADERLAAPAPFSPTGNPDETIGTLAATLAFHESYHCGQVGRARRDLGLEGKIRRG